MSRCSFSAIATIATISLSLPLPVQADLQPLPRQQLRPAPPISAGTKLLSCPTPAAELKRPDPDLPKGYSGKVFDALALPEGMTFVMSSLIEPTDDHALTEIRTPEQHLLLLEKFLCYDARGNPFFIVRDAIKIPRMFEKEILAVTSCTYRGVPDPEIVAVGEFRSEILPLRNLRKAWRAERSTLKIEEFPPDDVQCFHREEDP